MSETDASKINRVLESSEDIQQVSDLTGLTASAIRSILEKMLAEPELSEKAREFMDSNDRSLDFQAARAGQEAGRKIGHTEGFAKGVSTTIIAVGLIALAGAVLFIKSKE